MKKQRVTVRARMVQEDAEGNIKKYSVMDSRRGHSFEVPQFVLRLRNWAVRRKTRQSLI